MQNSSVNDTDTQYIPRNDEAEAERLAALTGDTEPLYLTEHDLKSYALDGMGFAETRDTQ